MPKYKKGDIVIVKTHDAFTGNVRIPAIIRYWDADDKAYYINALGYAGDEPALGGNLIHWPIREDEIECSAGQAHMDRPALSRQIRKRTELPRGGRQRC